jgi:hypothetical protein
MDVIGMTVQLQVANGSAAREWYETLFARPPDFRPEHDDSFIEWHFLPGYFELHVVEAPSPKSQEGRLRLGVADIEAERSRLLAAGFRVSEVEDLPGVVRWCNFEDRWGNRLGVHQDLARSGRG